MKLSEVDRINSTGIGSTAPSDKNGLNPEEFTRLLQNELNSGTMAMGESQAISQVDAMPQVFIPGVHDAAVDQGAVSAVESCLGDLEGIGNSLSNSEMSPKEVDKLLSSFQGEVRNLQGKLQDLSEDHPLKQIGSEMEVLSYVESVKWRRGDYV